MMLSGKTGDSGYRTVAERYACVQEWLSDQTTSDALDNAPNAENNDEDETVTLYCPPYDASQKRGKHHKNKDLVQQLVDNDELTLKSGSDFRFADEFDDDVWYTDARCDCCRIGRCEEQQLLLQDEQQCCRTHCRNHDDHDYRQLLSHESYGCSAELACLGFVVIGGISSVDWDCAERGGTAVWLYDLSRCTWCKLPPLPQPRHNFGSCVLDDVIYVTGGIHPKPCPYPVCPVDTTFILDPKVGYWCTGPSLTLARSHHKMLAYKGTVWLFGGKEQSGRYLNFVEFLGGDCGQWMMGESLPCPSAGMCAAVYDGRIFIAGGAVEENGISRETNATMSLEHCRWCYEPPLEYGCFCACMEEVNGCLYVLGGGKWYMEQDNRVTCHQCIVSLNEGQRAWMPVENLRFPCYNMATVAVGNELYIFGGLSFCNGTVTVLDTVDCFDIETCQIKPTGIKLPCPLAGFGCVLITDVSLFK